MNVLLVLCLNIGVDPPDLIKVDPTSTLECWLDPNSHELSKPLEEIGNALKTQYEKLQPRARYKICLDPTSDDVKKNSLLLRRHAKKERILFHCKI
jgi:regulator-associated protein of mTOR